MYLELKAYPTIPDMNLFKPREPLNKFRGSAAQGCAAIFLRL